MNYNAKVTGTGSAFPKKSVSNEELAKQLAKDGIETNHEWILERTGIVSRHYSETGNPDEFNSSLACLASQKALQMAGKTPEDIDQIIFATCTPDTPLPSNGCWLQKKLGAKNAYAMDLVAACSGFIYALNTADQAIRSGDVKTSLVVGSETLSSMTNWSDRSSCVLFGDAAGAVIVERAPADSQSKIITSHLQSDGNLWEILHVIAGGSNEPVSSEALKQKRNKIQMQGREVFKHAVRTLSQFATKALDEAKISHEDLDWFIPHQANLRIIEAVAKRLNIPMNKVILNLDKCGNTSSATVPTALDEAVRQGKIKSGQTVLMDVFGAGLTYGSLLLRW